MNTYKLTHTQARRLCTAAAVKVFEMDCTRPADWHTAPTIDPLTKSDQAYRAELLDAYDALMKQLY